MNKDNPVPSIDKIIKKFKNKICENKIQKDFIDKFNEFYKFQNGVETNKEQPFEPQMAHDYN